MTFPVSGVETPIWIPPLVALVVSFFTSMGGVSGAFLLLPFQVSVLGFTSPAVTPTNLVFNIVGIPSGVYRYFRDGRMAWPLAWNIMAGTLPGLFLGLIIRIRYLPDPRSFKLFVGLVLAYIGTRMIYGKLTEKKLAPLEKRTTKAINPQNEVNRGSDYGRVRTLSWSLKRTEYEFLGEKHGFHTIHLFTLSLVVGIIGGVYGIGGGALMAPFLITFFGLPVHSIAGATLMGTLVTSVLGVIFYTYVGPYYAPPQMVVSPDWLLGLLFGIGGFVGMYLGASVQKHIPSAIIKPTLGIIITGLGLKYIVGYFI
jgi:uncharacterized membrane protein YfcA